MLYSALCYGKAVYILSAICLSFFFLGQDKYPLQRGDEICFEYGATSAKPLAEMMIIYAQGNVHRFHLGFIYRSINKIMYSIVWVTLTPTK